MINYINSKKKVKFLLKIDSVRTPGLLKWAPAVKTWKVAR